MFHAGKKQRIKAQILLIRLNASMKERVLKHAQAKRLAKRIAGLVEKLDDLSNKIYHLTQRVEVLEKKLKVNDFNTEN